MSKSRILVAVLQISLFATAPAAAAQERLRTPRVSAVGTAEYQSIAAVRELSDGRVLVSDPEADRIWVVTPSGDRSIAVRNGTISRPGGLRALAADSTLVFSRADLLFKILAPDGRLSDARPSLSVPQDGTMRLSMGSDLYSADTSGRLYSVEGQRDTMGRIMRSGRNAPPTTVATIRNPPTRHVREGAIGFTMSTPNGLLDDWAVADNGDVVMARGEPYRVDRVTPDGVMHEGTPFPIASLPFTEKDRERFHRSREQSQRQMGAISIGGNATLPAFPADAFPAVKAPFVRGALLVARDGSAWVVREREADASETWIDVFGVDGRYRETVVAPKGARLVGFGAADAYLRVPSGGEERMTLHRVPLR